MAWMIAGLAGVTTVAAAGVWIWSTRGVETPRYAVEVTEGEFELRRYPSIVVASVRKQGDRDEAVRAGFGPLARYIFAKDRGGDKIAMTAPVSQAKQPEKIAMTAPVTQEQTESGWVVSFIMPSEFALSDLPAPSGDVQLSETPPRRVAAVRFSGRWNDANFMRAADRLSAWIEVRGLTPGGPIEYAYYNDPFTPFFLRRNEVMVEVGD